METSNLIANYLSIAASLFSLLSLFLSGYALYEVNKLNQKISQKGDHNKALNQNIQGDHNQQSGKL